MSSSRNKEKNNVKNDVRVSEKRVRNEIYETFAELDLYGFSYLGSQRAIEVVFRRLFHCKRKKSEENDRENNSTDSIVKEEVSDIDTLPELTDIRNMPKKIEARTLRLTANKLLELKNKEHCTIAHTTNSTTRKTVGSSILTKMNFCHCQI